MRKGNSVLKCVAAIPCCLRTNKINRQQHFSNN